jgi:hypothetical protein
MARSKTSRSKMRKSGDDTSYLQAMKRFNSIADTKGTISEKEMEFFTKLLSSRGNFKFKGFK